MCVDARCKQGFSVIPCFVQYFLDFTATPFVFTRKMVFVQRWQVHVKSFIKGYKN